MSTPRIASTKIELRRNVAGLGSLTSVVLTYDHKKGTGGCTLEFASPPVPAPKLRALLQDFGLEFYEEGKLGHSVVWYSATIPKSKKKQSSDDRLEDLLMRILLAFWGGLGDLARITMETTRMREVCVFDKVKEKFIWIPEGAGMLGRIKSRFT